MKATMKSVLTPSEKIDYYRVYDCYEGDYYREEEDNSECGDEIDCDVFSTISGSRLKTMIDEGDTPSRTLVQAECLRHVFCRISRFYAKIDYDLASLDTSEEAAFKASMLKEIEDLMARGDLPSKPDLRNLLHERTERNPYGIYIGVEGDDLITSSEAAALMGRSEKTLANRRDRGSGPNFTKVGNLVFYRRSDIEQFLSVCGDEPIRRR